jgi:dienelactone hydrolase
MRHRFFAEIVATVSLSAAFWMLSLGTLSPTTGQIWAQESATETRTESHEVSNAYNNTPFQYQSRLLSDRAQFRVYRLTYPSPVVTSVPQNNTIPADYYLPKQLQPGAKYPAVICLHILNGDEQLTDLVCSVLAKRGIPAISFKMPYYGERGLPKGPDALADHPKLFVGAIAQVGEDIRRTVDLLASRDEINPERIGITGISLGGITAATAAGAEPRLYRTSLMLSGGDLLPLIRHARETRQLTEMIDQLPPAERAEVETKIAEVDPLRFAPALRDRARQGRVLMINAGDDEVIPRVCTEKLAKALGIADQVAWFEGLGHYTAMAELPRALRMTADFFAQDLPPEAKPAESPATADSTALQRLVAIVEQIVTMLTVEPGAGRCHFVELELSANLGKGPEISSHVRLIRGAKGRFLLRCRLPVVGEVALGQNEYPWMLASGKTVLVGTKNPRPNQTALAYVESQHLMKLRMAAGIGGGIVLAPEILQQWISVEDDKAAIGGSPIRVAARDQNKLPGEVQIVFADGGRTPAAATFAVAGAQGKIAVRGWQTDTIAPNVLFDPPAGHATIEVDQTDLHRMMAAMLNVAADRLKPGRNLGPIGASDAMAVIGRDPAGHGLLCRHQGKLILMVAGSPAQMGTAHGTLLAAMAREMTERTVYLVGGADTLRSGQWFFDTMADIERRTMPHIPPRFFEECDALAKAAGVSQRDGRYTNLFPERFHCSGVAVRGKASLGGRILHARVLDYMRDIDLQESATVTVFMPEGRHAWMSLGYAGFIGTVTCMNEKGLAIGEMGGRGEGHWDGMPMALLLREIMEQASTVDEALDIFRKTPRTCEYYYVVSDRSGVIRGLECTPEKMNIMMPGEQDPRLAHVPEDTVMISGDDRSKILSQRLQENHGRIDVAKMIEIIKRPVSMVSNLHDAIFAPETLEMWFADAGKQTSACDEPYAHVNLRELIEFYAKENAPSAK